LKCVFLAFVLECLWAVLGFCKCCLGNDSKTFVSEFLLVFKIVFYKQDVLHAEAFFRRLSVFVSLKFFLKLMKDVLKIVLNHEIPPPMSRMKIRMYLSTAFESKAILPFHFILRTYCSCGNPQS
jgi:hypothetical protein